MKRELHRAGLRYHKEKLFRDCPAGDSAWIVDDQPALGELRPLRARLSLLAA